MIPRQIIKDNTNSYHGYADHVQISLAFSPNDFVSLESLCQYINQNNSWMYSRSATKNWIILILFESNN